MDLAALRWCLLFLVCCWVGPVDAALVYVGPQRYGTTSGANMADTPDATCTLAWVGTNDRVAAVAYDLRSSSGYALFGCLITYKDGTTGKSFNDQYRGWCAVGYGYYSAGSFSCWNTAPACPTGTAADEQGLCRAVCPSLGTQMGSRDLVLSSKSSSFLLCIGDCQWAPNVSAKQSDGTWANWGPYSSIGVRCTGSEGGSGSPAPAVCPAAQCPGTVNGTSVCVPCSDVKEPPKTTGTTAPPVDAGSAPAGSTPGSSSTTEQTTCSGGQCTTTRTTVTVGSSGGQTSQTTTTTQPIGTYCSVNPGAAVCAAEKEDPSTWGGSCAGFSCGGDAVQCAIAREQHVRNCALFDQATDLSRVGTAAATGQDPSDHPRSQAQSTTFALSSMLDSSPLFGSSGGCPADVSFAYAGQTLVIPFSQSCDVLHMLGAMWMGICYLVAATIVFYRR